MRNDEIEEEKQYVQFGFDARNKTYTPLPEIKLVQRMRPGYYNSWYDDKGLHFTEIPTTLEGLVDFDEGVTKNIIDEIDQFWSSESKFREINKSIKVLYKRGILIYGPPGCGKSSLIAMIMRDVVKRNGIALSFRGANQITDAIQAIRIVQPDTKVLVVIEDLDGFINRNGEEDVLNMLDGADTVLDNVLFLATSNYKEELSNRLLRPSRFDLKIELSHPGASLRQKYIKELCSSHNSGNKLVIKDVVADTDGMSFADLKELFISVCLFGRDYNSCLASLRNSSSDEVQVNSRGEMHGDRRAPSGKISVPVAIRALTAMSGKKLKGR